MVEVFKTNVNEYSKAEDLLQKIHRDFEHCQANFDLEDCDKILRVESRLKTIDPSEFINLLKESGYLAEVLPDTIPG